MVDKKIQMNDLITWMEELFKKAPHLPKNIQELMVTVAPWLALIFGILGILGGIGAVGVSPVALFGGLQSSFLVLISGILAITSSVLLVMAYPKLLKRSMAGWTLLFWADVVSAVASLLSLSLGAVIWMILAFYLLFEIKKHYK